MQVSKELTKISKNIEETYLIMAKHLSPMKWFDLSAGTGYYYRNRNNIDTSIKLAKRIKEKSKEDAKKIEKLAKETRDLIDSMQEKVLSDFEENYLDLIKALYHFEKKFKQGGTRHTSRKNKNGQYQIYSYKAKNTFVDKSFSQIVMQYITAFKKTQNKPDKNSKFLNIEDLKDEEKIVEEILGNNGKKMYIFKPNSYKIVSLKSYLAKYQKEIFEKYKLILND